MESAISPGTAPPNPLPQDLEDHIRTLGISLIAIAAVVVSLTIVRQRHEERHPEPGPTQGRAPAASGLNLDAIRTAGL